MEAAHFPLRFPTGYKAGLPALRSLRSATVPPCSCGLSREGSWKDRQGGRSVVTQKSFAPSWQRQYDPLGRSCIPMMGRLFLGV